MARVKLNGKDLGVVWTDAMAVEDHGRGEGERQSMEIDVVNLWPPTDWRRRPATSQAVHKDERNRHSTRIGAFSLRHCWTGCGSPRRFFSLDDTAARRGWRNRRTSWESSWRYRTWLASVCGRWGETNTGSFTLQTVGQVLIHRRAARPDLLCVKTKFSLTHNVSTLANFWPFALLASRCRFSSHRKSAHLATLRPFDRVRHTVQSHLSVRTPQTRRVSSQCRKFDGGI